MSNQGKEQQRRRQQIAGTHPQFRKYEAIPRDDGISRELVKQKRTAPPAPLEVWEAALNNRGDIGTQQGQSSETKAQSARLRGDLTRFDPSSGISVKRTDLTGPSLVRVGPAIVPEGQELANYASSAPSWNLQLEVSEGDKGGSFANRTLFIPMLGGVFQTRGNYIEARLLNQSGVAATLFLSLAISEEREQLTPQRRDRQSNIASIALPLYTESVSYSLSGGVALGDTISFLGPDLVVYSTIPASSIGVHPVPLNCDRVRYNKAAGVPALVSWVFNIRK